MYTDKSLFLEVLDIGLCRSRLHRLLADLGSNDLVETGLLQKGKVLLIGKICAAFILRRNYRQGLSRCNGTSFTCTSKVCETLALLLCWG